MKIYTILFFSVLLGTGSPAFLRSENISVPVEEMRMVAKQFKEGKFDDARNMLEQKMSSLDKSTPEGKAKFFIFNMYAIGADLLQTGDQSSFTRMESFIKEVDAEAVTLRSITIGRLPADIYLHRNAADMMAEVLRTQKQYARQKIVLRDLVTFLNQKGTDLQRKVDAGLAGQEERDRLNYITQAAYMARWEYHNPHKDRSAEMDAPPANSLRAPILLDESLPTSDGVLGGADSSACSAPASQPIDECGCSTTKSSPVTATPAADSCCATPTPAAQ